MRFGYVILCDADLDESYSWEGLVVAKGSAVKGPDGMKISKKMIKR